MDKISSFTFCPELLVQHETDVSVSCRLALLLCGSSLFNVALSCSAHLSPVIVVLVFINIFNSRRIVVQVVISRQWIIFLIMKFIKLNRNFNTRLQLLACCKANVRARLIDLFLLLVLNHANKTNAHYEE